MPAGEMAAQLAGGVFPTFIGRGAGGNARRDAEGMQQPIDRERVEIARVDLLLLLEDAGRQDGPRQAGRARVWLGGFLRFIGGQGLNDCRGADQAEAGGAGRCLEKVATRTIHHDGTPARTAYRQLAWEAEILAEERHHVILKTIRHGAGVRARIDLEAVGDSVFIEDVMQLAGIGAQAILVAHVHGDGTVLAEIADVLIDEGQGRIGRPLRQHIRLRHAIFRRQIEIERRILRVGRPGRRAGELGAREERQLGRILRRLHRCEGLSPSLHSRGPPARAERQHGLMM